VRIVIDPSHGTDGFDDFIARLVEAHSPHARNDLLFVVVNYHGTYRVRKYTIAIYVWF
jgi:hypothetical protein